MSNLVPLNQAQLPASIQALMSQMTSSELSENVGQNYAVISIRGKVFRIKHGGNEQPIMINYNGQTFPAPSIDLVIPKANSVLAKTFYRDNFAEGSNAQPDCYSEDGIHPLVAQPVSHDCRTCPMNQFGSKITDAGTKAKACADTRKVGVLPIDDLVNDRFGGPMLFRVPAASLGPLAEYDAKLRAMGVPYFAVVTRVSFDQTVAYPKLVFEAVRMLTEAEAALVIECRSSEKLDAVLSLNATPPVAAIAGPQAGAAIPGTMPAQFAGVPAADPLAGSAVPQQFAGPVADPAAQYVPPAPVTTFMPPAQTVVPATIPAATPVVVQQGATFGPAPTNVVPLTQPAATPPANTAGPVMFGSAPVNAAPVQTAPVSQPATTPAANPPGAALSAEFFNSIDNLLNT